MAVTDLTHAKTSLNFQEKIYKNRPFEYIELEKKFENYPKQINISIDNKTLAEYMKYAEENDPKCGYVSDLIVDKNRFYSVNDKQIYTYLKENNRLKLVKGLILKNKKYAIDRAKIQKAITELNKIKVTGSAYEKAKLLRNSLTGKISYCHGKTIDSRTIYAICTKHGNCVAYSLCYKYLCNRHGIPCETVQSKTHMWNVVKIKGKWYNVEPQAGHCNSIRDYRAYKDNDTFLISDAAIKRKNYVSYKRINKKNIKCRSNYKHPKMPSNIRVTVKHKKAKIKWSKGKNATGYIFQWKYKGGKYKTIKTRKRSITISAKPKKTICARLKPYEGSFYRPSFAFTMGKHREQKY